MVMGQYDSDLICSEVMTIIFPLSRHVFPDVTSWRGKVVWSSLGHPLGSTQKVPCRRQCLTGDPFIHCKLAKWEQPKGALQAKVPYRGGALQGHDHCIAKMYTLNKKIIQ